MDELSKRFATLSPKQRELLALRLKKKGLDPVLLEESHTAATPQALFQTGAGFATVPVLPETAYSLPPKGMQFSLFFFSDNGTTTTQNKYHLLLESAKFADTHGFCAVWTPERHFQAFGGLYPNPSVLGAALAVLTKNVQIRAGSVAVPLHHPVRVAEEWAVVDNLSEGRVGVSFASGWHPRDFLFAPANFENRREVMLESIRLIQQLWAGETVAVPGVDGELVDIQLFPRPIQPTLPFWVTSAGNPDTWIKAGEMGGNVLAMLSEPYDKLGQKIKLYRDALQANGHDPHGGHVSIMVHTYLGSDLEVVKARVREPMRDYLRTYLRQFDFLESLGIDPRYMKEQDQESILSFAFENYFHTSSLLGTPEKCWPILEALRKIGVNEVACLIDFGLETELVLEGLNYLNHLRLEYAL